MQKMLEESQAVPSSQAKEEGKAEPQTEIEIAESQQKTDAEVAELQHKTNTLVFLYSLYFYFR
jgi:hypothetical protein